jgi:hypothetical protein
LRPFKGQAADRELVSRDASQILHGERVTIVLSDRNHIAHLSVLEKNPVPFPGGCRNDIHDAVFFGPMIDMIVTGRNKGDSFFNEQTVKMIPRFLKPVEAMSWYKGI